MGGYLHVLQAFGVQMLRIRACLHDFLCILFHVLYAGSLLRLAQG